MNNNIETTNGNLPLSLEGGTGRVSDILEEIIAHKRIEVARQKEAVSLQQLQDYIEAHRADLPNISMKASLAASPTGVIAEFKRRSPSKGWINREADPSVIPPAYEQAGAAALSILTDEKFFGGSLKDILTARPLVKLPILRKDFIIDEYQLFQAKAVGANAVLLIAACLSTDECKLLTEKAHELGLEVLLEIHSESELPYITPNIDMVGVNNRNLGTFHTDVQNSFRLAELLPSDVLKVSESGISHPDTVRQLREVGFRGFLIGEALMKQGGPTPALPLGRGRVHSTLLKVCGMRESDNIRAVESLGVDWMGFIFYPYSPRYVEKVPDYLPTRAKRIGVFVDEEKETILHIARKLSLYGIQLHGNEAPCLCRSLREEGFCIIKALPISTATDLQACGEYEGCIDYFLFDTACTSYGGSGRRFDWSVLQHYHGATPFLLSGGLRPENIDEVLTFHHPKLAGVDLNSGFEFSPAVKDVAALQEFINKYRKQELI